MRGLGGERFQHFVKRGFHFLCSSFWRCIEFLNKNYRGFHGFLLRAFFVAFATAVAVVGLLVKF